MENNSNYSPKSRYLLNFSFFQKRFSSKEDFRLGNPAFSKDCMSSNIISESSLETNHILLKKKSLLKRKSMGSLKIFYSEIIDLKLNKSDLSSLYSSIEIVFSKNGYTKHLIVLSSSDAFAVRWFYDELVVRFSLSKSNLNEKRFNSNEKIIVGNGNGVENVNSQSDEDIQDENVPLDKNGQSDANKINESRESTLDEFMNQMNAEISEKRKREIAKQMKFDRCSSGEY